MEIEKCMVRKFKLRDFTKLDEAYKRMFSRAREIFENRLKSAELDLKNAKLNPKDLKKKKGKTQKDGNDKKINIHDVELTDLIAEAVCGEDLITIVECGTTGCKVDELDWDEGLEMFKRIVKSEENKDFFSKSYEAKMLAVSPSASLSDTGTSSSSSSEKG